MSVQCPRGSWGAVTRFLRGFTLITKDSGFNEHGDFVAPRFSKAEIRVIAFLVGQPAEGNMGEVASSCGQKKLFLWGVATSGPITGSECHRHKCTHVCVCAYTIPCMHVLGASQLSCQ